MTGPQIALAGYLAVVNLTALYLFALDKRRARRRMWRVPERTLLLCAALGGSLGALLGMHLAHHKTRTPVFEFGVPTLLIAHCALFAYLFWRFS